MQWLRKFMMGRYGSDQLNFALILLSLVLSIIGSFTPLGALGSLISMIPLVLAVVRMLSRNRAKRMAENAKYMKVWTPVRLWFQWLWLSIRYCNKNRYFRCPKCGRIACIPKKTGKVTITCKNCRTKYDKKA